MPKTSYFDDLNVSLRAFSAERDWDRHHAPRNLAASVAIEAAELLELFQWDDGSGDWSSVQHGQKHQRVREELADVLIYALRFADLAKIDVAQAIDDKMAANALKYPPQERFVD